MRVTRVRWWWACVVWVAWCRLGAAELHRRRERYSDVQVQDDSMALDTEECIYPCSCATTGAPDCAPGVVAERDGCGCCLVCPRQAGEPCGAAAPCDTHRGLVCRPQRRQRVSAMVETGICRESNGLPCVVYNKTYEHGETFSLDCRTQCACQLHAEMWKWGDGGWKKNFFVVKRNDACNSLYLCLGPVWAFLVDVAHAKQGCPVQPLQLEVWKWGDGGWIKNFYSLKRSDACNSLYLCLGPVWVAVVEAAHAKQGCPVIPNGTYGCSSLCPQEHISPKGSCSHPRLVDVPGQCCREWMCDSQAIQQPPECQPTFTRWSRCSATCGVGVSRRRSNLNAACEATTETRLCQLRRCDTLRTNPFRHPADTHHHVRKGHECKATHRLTQPVRLRFGPCFSRKLFRPKHCGGCSSPGVHCDPLLSTTVKVDFLCSAPPGDASPPSADMNLALEFLEPGEDMWREPPAEWNHDQGLQITVSVQWILKCRCGGREEGLAPPTAASGEVILHRVHRTAAP